MIQIPSKEQFSFLNELRDLAYQDAKDKGWHSSEESPKFGDFMSNLHSEVSELWESYRNNTLNELCDKSQKMVEHGLEPLTSAEEEIADIIIRTLDTAAAFKVDVAKATIVKILFNRTRTHRNGGKLV